MVSGEVCMVSVFGEFGGCVCVVCVCVGSVCGECVVRVCGMCGECVLSVGSVCGECVYVRT